MSNFSNFIGQNGGALLSAGLGLAGTALGGFYQEKINERNIEAQKEARLDNFKYNEQAANNADARARAMQADYWKMYNSPEAQLANRTAALDKFGISKTLAYSQGAGGAGGGAQANTMMAQGAGAVGLGAPEQRTPLSAFEGAQLGLMLAQTKKTNAEAENLKGNTPTAQASIAQMLADAGLKNAAANLTKAQNTAQDLENEINKNTKDFKIRAVEATARKLEFESTLAMYEALNSEQDLTLKQETFDAAVASSYMQVGQQICDILLKQAQTDETRQRITESKAQIQKWAYDCLLGYGQMLIAQQNADSLSELQSAQAEYFRKMKEMLPKELTQGYWKIGVGAATDIIKFAGNMLMFRGMGGGGSAGKAAATGGALFQALFTPASE